MNQIIAAKIALFILLASTFVILSLFGSLGASVQSCNTDAWFKAVRPILGQGAMGSVKLIWVTLFVVLLFPFFQSFKVKGRSKVTLLSWSSIALLILIAVRSIELAPNC